MEAERDRLTRKLEEGKKRMKALKKAVEEGQAQLEEGQAQLLERALADSERDAGGSDCGPS